MAKLHTLLSMRLKNKEASSQKIATLAERSSQQNLSHFAGAFRIDALSELEREKLKQLLHSYRENESYDVDSDLSLLLQITAEVKAITNQAALLHGERIKKAQQVLKSYQDGAFTAWLITTYGNRQTPYNFLQYYEFYTAMPVDLHSQIDRMPRQAVYTLASRKGSLEVKQDLVESYAGESKQEILGVIRKKFPLQEKDKRLPNISHQTIHSLLRIQRFLEDSLFCPTKEEKKKLIEILEDLKARVNKS